MIFEKSYTFSNGMSILFLIQSSLYVWIIFLTGIFYTLPVLQMIAEHQRTSNATGNLDLCYYNYLCKVNFFNQLIIIYQVIGALINSLIYL